MLREILYLISKYLSKLHSNTTHNRETICDNYNSAPTTNHVTLIISLSSKKFPIQNHQYHLLQHHFFWRLSSVIQVGYNKINRTELFYKWQSGCSVSTSFVWIWLYLWEFECWIQYFILVLWSMVWHNRSINHCTNSELSSTSGILPISRHIW